MVAGVLQQGKARVVGIEESAPQLRSKLRAAMPVPEVQRFIDPAGVVEHSEEFYYFQVGARCERREPTTVLQDAGPMAHAVNARGRQGIVLQDPREER